MPVQPPKPFIFGKPEKRHWIRLIAFCVFVVVGLAFIGWLIHVAKPMRPLVCDSDNVPLTEFGTCHDN